MIVDLADGTEPPSLEGFDVIIAGAGVAGIIVALKLARTGKRVLLLEAGGIAGGPQTQEWYRGENTGTENLLLHRTRLRQFGGSSNHWGGWCRLFDAYDFSRTDLGQEAWPIGRSDLAPYGNEAAALLGVTQASGGDLPLADSEQRLQTIRMFFSVPPARLGDRNMEELQSLPNLLLLVNAPVTDLELAPDGARVTAITIRAPNGRARKCPAKVFILAMGAVENVRRLLIWNRGLQDRLGNRSGLLGLCYMQHLHQAVGRFVLFDDVPPEAKAAAATTPAFFASSERQLRDSGGGAYRLYSSDIDCRVLTGALAAAGPAAACRPTSRAGQLYVTAEQLPDRRSRILLASEPDGFGEPRVRLDWRINEGDARTLLNAAMEFGKYLVRTNLGRLQIHPAVLAQTTPMDGWTALPSAPGAAGHQLGGARMSGRADDGVVDANCLVWGSSNLYVAGSAVFRTSSHANPTLTIAQLALRLTAEVQRRLG